MTELPELIEERRAMVVRMLQELREGAKASQRSRNAGLALELPNVTLRDGPFQGLPPDPLAAWGPIPGTMHGAWPRPPKEHT